MRYKKKNKKRKQKAQRLVLHSTEEGEKEKPELKKREVAGITEHERLRVKVSCATMLKEETDSCSLSTLT